MSKVARIVTLALLVAVLVGRWARRALWPSSRLGRAAGPGAVITMPAVDVEALMAEDVLRYEEGLPPRFAQPIPVQITPAGYGIWEAQADGTRLWRLRISSPGRCR